MKVFLVESALLRALLPPSPANPCITTSHEISRNLIIFGTSVPLLNQIEIGQDVQRLLKGARETRQSAQSHKYCFLRTRG